MQQTIQQNKISFHDIPQEYQLQMKMLDSIVLKEIYSKFNFKYLNVSSIKISNNEKDQPIEILLVNYLKEFRLITIDIIYNQKSRNNDIINLISQKVNSILCYEGNCLIIDEIDLNLLYRILKETNSLIINVSESSENETTSKDEEIDIFCHQFISTNQIKSNKFVKNTIKPILTYLMQRYYCPSIYFKDPSFL